MAPSDATTARNPGISPVKQPVPGIRPLLVAVDLSPASEKVVAAACRIAQATKAQVFVVHCAEPDPDLVGYDRDQVADSFRNDHLAVQELSERMRSEGVDATALLIRGSTIETTLREVGRLNPEMIVLGCHGHGAVYDLLIGSNSAGILRKSGIPVLLVPTRDQCGAGSLSAQ
ncbi:MAG: universal stress protein [Gammaproteobacteria bacterium]